MGQEQINTFEKQIEKSLDLRVDQLRELDEKKSKTLSAIKDKILDEIKKERDEPQAQEKKEKYSADLRITEKELEAIFEEVKREHADLFKEIGIDQFWKFKELIDLSYGTEISAHDEVRNIQVFGKNVDFTLPIGTNEQNVKNYQKIFRTIEGRKDLEPFITPVTRFIPRGGIRIEFSIQNDGKEVRYSATPDSVLRIDREIAPEKKKEWTQVSLKIYQTQRQIITWPFETEDQRDLINRLVNNKGIEGDRDLEKNKLVKLPEKLQSRLNELNSLRLQEKALREECSQRALFDEQNKIAVLEEGSPLNNNYFSYTSLSKGVYKKIEYNDNKKTREEIKDTSDGSKTTTKKFRPDGFLETAIEEKDGKTLQSELYDESGHITQRIIFDNEHGRVEVEMISPDGVSLGSFDREKTKDSSLTESQYCEKFKKIITTPDLFFRYEEAIIQRSKFSPELQKSLRVFGKEITGINKKENALKTKYGIDIETEGLSNYADKQGILTSIKNLDLRLDSLSTELEKYPSQLIKNSKIKKVYIFDKYSTKNDSGSYDAAGFYFTGSAGEIAIDYNPATIHHELFHCIDFETGEHSHDDEWGERAHGKEFKEIYGKNGAAAIISGKNNEPRPAGFPSAYAKYGGITEDKAVMAEHLVCNSKVMDFIVNEPSLNEKVRMTKEIYLKVSEGRMDEQFWRDLKEGKSITKDYWTSRERNADFQKIAIDSTTTQASYFEKAKKWVSSFFK